MSTIIYTISEFQKIGDSLLAYQKETQSVYYCLDLSHRVDFNDREGIALEIKKFVNDLANANVKAYNERYGENEPLKMISFPESLPLGKLFLIKTLRSLRYNLDGEEINDCQTKLNFVLLSLCLDNLDQNPAYQQAKFQ